MIRVHYLYLGSDSSSCIKVLEMKGALYAQEAAKFYNYTYIQYFYMSQVKVVSF